MASTDNPTEPVITSQPNIGSPTSPVVENKSRKVSIITEPMVGHDNLGFEPNPKRKISQTSMKVI